MLATSRTSSTVKRFDWPLSCVVRAATQNRVKSWVRAARNRGRVRIVILLDLPIGAGSWSGRSPSVNGGGRRFAAEPSEHVSEAGDGPAIVNPRSRARIRASDQLLTR